TLGIHRWIEKNNAYGVRPFYFSTAKLHKGNSQVFFIVWSVWCQGRNRPTTASCSVIPRCFAVPPG
ncbi:hypothetical protein HMPREF0083_05910, partial [Aneurinibacillus aneurinilyticus ATCC 12856]